MVELNKSPPKGDRIGMLHPNRSMFLHSLVTAGLVAGVVIPIATHIHTLNQDIAAPSVLQSDEKSTSKRGEAATWEAYIQEARRARDAKSSSMSAGDALTENRVRLIVTEEVKSIHEQLDRLEQLLSSDPNRPNHKTRPPPLNDHHK
jgi:hypothetical protein